MPDPSINAKFGLDAGPFRRGLSDVRNRLRGMDRNVNQVNRSVSRLRSSMQLLRTAFVAGGIATFFRSAFNRAEELRESTDENVQAVLRFKEAMEGVKGGFADLSVAAIGSLNRVGEKFGDLINMGRDIVFGGFSVEESRANIEAANRSREQADARQRDLEESRKREDERRKQVQSDTEAHQRDVEGIQKNINTLAEQEAQIRDRAFLRSLGPEELAAELEERMKASGERSWDAFSAAFNQESRVRQLEADVEGETPTEKADRLLLLEQERLKLANLMVARNQENVRTAELETQLTELRNQLEQEQTEEKERQADLDRQAAQRLADRIRDMREEKRIAQENFAQAQQAEAEAKADFYRPTLADLAGSGRGRAGQTARQIQTLERRAQQARLRGTDPSRATAEQLEARARAMRQQLTGIIRQSDAEIFEGVERNTKQAAEYLEQISRALEVAEVETP